MSRQRGRKGGREGGAVDAVVAVMRAEQDADGPDNHNM